MTGDETPRACPRPGCRRKVPATRYACAADWRALPLAIRVGISRAWRAFAHGRGTMDQLLAEQAKAVAHWQGRP